MPPSFCRGLLVVCSVAALPACSEARAVVLDRSTSAAVPVSSGAAGVDDPSAEASSCSAAQAPTGAPAAAPAAAAPSACPDTMVRVGEFCIDRYEAHLVSRAASGEVAVHPYFERPAANVVYEARSGAGVFPQGYVSRTESEAACAQAGKRLCTMNEWQRACRGPRGTTYPHGDRWLPRRCNTDKAHLITLRFGGDPRRWSYGQFNDPVLDQEPGFLARSGEHPGCVGDNGVHDLVGNLHEWVSDVVDATMVRRMEAEAPRAYQPWRAGNGVFMGGFFSTHGELGPGCKFTTIAHEPGYHDYSTGFRCCAEPL